MPVYIEVNADLDTPVSAFLKIRTGAVFFSAGIRGRPGEDRQVFFSGHRPEADIQQ